MQIGIAGAGVMGRVLAWQCLQAGWQVTLFDKDPIDHGDAAAYTAAGMLTPYCEVESADLLVFTLGLTSINLWQNLQQSLDTDIGLLNKGSLVVAHRQDMADLQHFIEIVSKRVQANANDFQILKQSDLKTLEPELSTLFNQAVYLPTEANLCPQKTLQALAKRLLEKNITWHSDTTIESVTAKQVSTNKQTYDFDTVIDCRGLGAKPQWQALRGVRGEVITLQAPEVRIQRMVRLMHPRYPLYLVPKGYDNLYTIGATQIESQDSGKITVRSSLELLSAAYSLHKGFAEARIVETKTNCRPALLDNLPKIISSPGLIKVNGLYRHGFLLSPILANEVVQQLSNPHYQSNYHQLMQAA